jgi:hypothetical protein
MYSKSTVAQPKRKHCGVPGRAPTQWSRGEKHLHGDHDTPIQDRPDLRFDLDNYRTRCNECHSAKTMREQNAGMG